MEWLLTGCKIISTTTFPPNAIEIMSLKAQQVAEWMLAKASIDGEPLTNLKLQKLVYIANGWHLGLLNESLFDDDVHAWQYGPVVPCIYRSYKGYGANGINDSGRLHRFDEQTTALLDVVWESYANFSAVQLVAMTHKPGTPWSKTYREGRDEVIPTSLIRSHYQELAAKYGTKQPC